MCCLDILPCDNKTKPKLAAIIQ
uniref:Uncharacterized protein n=1 Tax=Arundo donax TaxID=35708 RepID=A0A0A9FTK6_ARUDO